MGFFELVGILIGAGTLVSLFAIFMVFTDGGSKWFGGRHRHASVSPNDLKELRDRLDRLQASLDELRESLADLTLELHDASRLPRSLPRDPLPRARASDEPPRPRT